MQDHILMLMQVRHFIERSEEGKLPIFVPFPNTDPVAILDSQIDTRAFKEHFKDEKQARLVSVLEGAIGSGLLVGEYDEVSVGSHGKKKGISIRGVTLLGHKFNIYGLKGT